MVGNKICIKQCVCVNTWYLCMYIMDVIYINIYSFISSFILFRLPPFNLSNRRPCNRNYYLKLNKNRGAKRPNLTYITPSSFNLSHESVGCNRRIINMIVFLKVLLSKARVICFMNKSGFLLLCLHFISFLKETRHWI